MEAPGPLDTRPAVGLFIKCRSTNTKPLCASCQIDPEHVIGFHTYYHFTHTDERVKLIMKYNTRMNCALGLDEKKLCC